MADAAKTPRSHLTFAVVGNIDRSTAHNTYIGGYLLCILACPMNSPFSTVLPLYSQRLSVPLKFSSIARFSVGRPDNTPLGENKRDKTAHSDS